MGRKHNCRTEHWASVPSTPTFPWGILHTVLVEEGVGKIGVTIPQEVRPCPLEAYAQAGREQACSSLICSSQN